MTDNYQGPGIYKHYKGGEYHVLGLALHEHAKDNRKDFDPHDTKFHQVIYKPLTPGSRLSGSPATMWIRRLDRFNEQVELVGDIVKPNGEIAHHLVVPRFKKIANA